MPCVLFDLWTMTSFTGSLPLAKSTISGINTNTSGTARSKLHEMTKDQIKSIRELTPTSNGDRNHELCCYSGENNDQFLEHEKSLGSHPHHSH